jgi:predicted aspartyl protease
VTLANGSIEQVDIYAAALTWDGTRRDILVEAADTEPLVGMALLHGYRIDMHVIAGGRLAIERLA